METTQFKRDEILIDKIMGLIKDHAQSSEKILRCLRIQWTQVGYDLKVNGLSIEYKHKPTKKP